MPTTIFQVFESCVRAVRAGRLIRRESRQDKEFHFQNWFRDRLSETGLNSEAGGRNSYPDFRMVAVTEGYEVKGLAYPGREANYDSNSQVPTGTHNGRTIFYVFGRYPVAADGDTYPVLDLVLCHGDFLNATHDYVHKNRSVKGFGTYGDIMIRDRKMYVAPTPFGLLNGVAHNLTLLLPRDYSPPAAFVRVGDIVRREAELLIVGYDFDLRSNNLTPHTVANPNAGREHLFRAWRVTGQSADEVEMRARVVLETPDEEAE